MKNLIIGLMSSVCFFRAEIARGQYIDIIGPEGAGGVEGNSSAIPLNTGGPERFQQVYRSSLFSGAGQDLAIGQIAFRVDAFIGSSFTSTVTNIELHLSTTSKQVDGLSSIFDQNVGADDKTVIGRGPIHFEGSGGGGVVGPWSVVFNMTSNPFEYRPAAGNLLMDIKVFSGAGTTYFYAVDVTGGSGSSGFGTGASLPASGQASSLGLATFFAVQPIPEPC